MTPRISARRWLGLLLLWSSLPAFSQQIALEPVRLPAAALSAPRLLSQPVSLAAPALQSRLLAPSLSAPALSAAPAPALAPGWALHASGLAVPAEHAAPAQTGFALGAALAKPDAQPAQVLADFYDGASRAAPADGGSASEVPSAAGYLAETKGLSGQALLSSLHQISGRGYRTQSYKDTSHFLFGVAYNVESHGTRGVVDAYSGIFVPGTSDNGGDYSERGDEDGDGYAERDGMNVEHTWPQSFFDKALPMRSDIHHLLPTFQHPNSMRSNLPFGEVSGDAEYSNNAGAKEGHGVFEPPDVSKGQVARHVLYFYMRYFDRNITQGAYSHRFFKDRVEMFLRWNREHPPTAEERQANDEGQRWQGNRNPFVDDFTLADRIGAEGFRGAPTREGSQVSQQRPQQPVPSYKDRQAERRNRHRHGDRRPRYYSAAPRLSPLDFALH